MKRTEDVKELKKIMKKDLVENKTVPKTKVRRLMKKFANN